MAFTPHDVEDIEYLAGAMKVAADALMRLSANMRTEGLSPIFLQLSVAKTYADSLYRLASETDFQFRNQIHARKTGKLPAYQLRQQKNALDKAKREAKATQVDAGFVKQPVSNAAKKPAKKSSKAVRKSTQ